MDRFTPGLFDTLGRRGCARYIKDANHGSDLCHPPNKPENIFMMNEQIVFLSGGLPHTLHGGGGITAFSIVDAIQRAGKTVTVIGLKGRYETPYDAEAQRQLSPLGVHVIWIDPEAATAGERRRECVPGYDYARGVARVVTQLDAGTCVCYHWDALAMTERLSPGVLRAGFVGDPIHLPSMYRQALVRKYQSGGATGLVRRMREWRLVQRQMAEQRALLSRCDVCGAFAAHHARWFRKHGVPGCRYVHTPVPDPFRNGAACAAATAPTNRPVLLLLGHLAGTATLAGVDLFVHETLPVLDASFGPNGYEVLVVGGMQERMPAFLQDQLKRHPAIRLLGQVNPPDSVFASSHFLIVPTPIELGIRVRIITGFSFGACVVAHLANQCGIPEMQHGINSILCRDGAAMGRDVVALWQNLEQRTRLMQNGRALYESTFAPEVAGDAIASRILCCLGRGGDRSTKEKESACQSL